MDSDNQNSDLRAFWYLNLGEDVVEIVIYMKILVLKDAIV